MLRLVAHTGTRRSPFPRVVPFAAAKEKDVAVTLCQRQFGKNREGAKTKKHTPPEDSKDDPKQGFSLDNLAAIRQQAEAIERKLENPKISKALLKCETSTDFLAFAESAGAKLSGTNSSHVKSDKVRLRPYVRKQKIDAFKAMGIAWDENLLIGPQSLAEEIRDLLLDEGEMEIGNLKDKYQRKYDKAEDSFKQGKLSGTLHRLAAQSGLFEVKRRLNGMDANYWLVPRKSD